MGILMFIGTAYAVLYVLWLLVMIVSGMPERWVAVTLFFILVPMSVAICSAIIVVAAFVSPFIYFFSAKARQDFRDRMRTYDVI